MTRRRLKDRKERLKKIRNSKKGRVALEAEFGDTN
jgi:hypothetical protein